MFETYTPPPPLEGDSFAPKDHTDRPLIVKVGEYRERQTSSYAPDGKPAVVVHVVDLTDGEVYRNVLWMGGAVVDQLRPYVGKAPLVIRFGWAAGKSGNNYVTVNAAGEQDLALAKRFIDTKGDPFVQLSTTAQPAQSAAPAATPPAQQPAQQAVTPSWAQ